MKRVDHTARALREEEGALLKNWKVTVQENTEKTLKEVTLKKFAEAKKKYDLAQENKEFLVPYIAQKAIWFEEQMQDRYADNEKEIEKAEQRREAQMKQLILQKIE